MTFGTSWEWGSTANGPESREIYDAFRSAGGNFIDTANTYTDGESEEFVGRLIAGERDSVVVATKFTVPSDDKDLNSGGSHRKNLRRSVETSLRRLGTDYIDLLWVHAWDQCTPVDETVRALDDLVSSGKVLAIGVSNTPAWVIARAQTMAELNGWAPFCGLQVEYSLAARAAERELLPMAAELNLFVTAWSPLDRGLLARGAAHDGELPLEPRRASAVRIATGVAATLGTTVPRVALAWVLRHGITPVLGASKVEQITEDLSALELALDDEILAQLDEATSIDLGYPHELLRDYLPTLRGSSDWSSRT